MRRLPGHASVVAAALSLVAGCHGGGGTPADMSLSVDPLVAARPYSVTLPAGHDAATPSPLIIVLHGYTATGVLEDTYLGFSEHADEHGTIVALPDGMIDPLGNHYWNATDGCCDVFDSGVDDVAYLTAVIKDAIARYGADPKRIFLMGHSNGGFMAHRMACDRSELIAGIAALAGVVWEDMSKCQPTQKVAVAQIHGTLDDTIAYAGGDHAGGQNVATLHPFPGAEATIQFWATQGGCTATMDGGTLDLDFAEPGAETQLTRWTGCAAGAAAELWKIVGGNHVPKVTPDFPQSVYAFFAAHGRP